jgi:hypothetical protein
MKRSGRVNFRHAARRRGAGRASPLARARHGRGCSPRAPALALTRRAAAAAAFCSGLWEAESAENYEAFLVACGARRVALFPRVRPPGVPSAEPAARAGRLQRLPPQAGACRPRSCLARRRCVALARRAPNNCAAQALLHLSKPTQFYKHRGDEMEFSQMQQARRRRRRGRPVLRR